MLGCRGRATPEPRPERRRCLNVSLRRFVAVAAVSVVSALLLAWAAAAAPSHHAAKRGTVVTIGSTEVGRILIDARGRTPYVYTPDGKNKSACYGQSASF